MKLSQQTLARKRPQQHPMAEHLRHDVEEQLELPDMPPPATANRARDLHKCKRCQSACGYCTVSRADETPDPLGR